MKERTEDRDAGISNETICAQITAIHTWRQGDPSGLSEIRHPALVANGGDDVMAPTINAFELARRLPNAQLGIFPDASYGGMFQYHSVFVQQTLDFLRRRDGPRRPSNAL